HTPGRPLNTWSHGLTGGRLFPARLATRFFVRGLLSPLDSRFGASEAEVGDPWRSEAMGPSLPQGDAGGRDKMRVPAGSRRIWVTCSRGKRSPAGLARGVPGPGRSGGAHRGARNRGR